MANRKNALQQLYAQAQSPWLDFITRDILNNGRLQELIDSGITGLTSNPTILQKAMASSALYHDELRRLVREGKSVAEIYDALVLDDIRNAAMMFRPVYDRTNGRDGLVSIEEPPSMAYDTGKSLEEARRLFSGLGLPNVMVKIPGTPQGIIAFQQALTEGINVNVTLVFAIDTYRAVAAAYITALEQRVASGQPIDWIA
jgi:transaldolase